MGYVEAGGYNRDMSYIDDRVVRDADGERRWPVEAGRYRLVGSRACPWAHRAIITRRLVGLDTGPDPSGPAPLSLGLCGPTHDWKSWTFDLDADSVDPVLGVGRLRDCYLHRFSDYPKGITVPALVKIGSKAVVANEFRTMVTGVATEWNNGVYRCGFAGDQASYEEAFRALFTRLDELEGHLADRRYLVGDHLTLADVYLFATLVRFDHVYHGHFKCNRNRIAEMPNLWGYLRDLFQTPGFGDTVNLDQIKQHYYRVHTDINPTGVVAVGPDPAAFYSPHGRDRLGGSPFWNPAGDATAPAAPRPEDVRDGDEAGAFV